jgi:hypothetical protein
MQFPYQDLFRTSFVLPNQFRRVSVWRRQGAGMKSPRGRTVCNRGAIDGVAIMADMDTVPVTEREGVRGTDRRSVILQLRPPAALGGL